jgi:GNAT superfamily N-acetyltransferase
LLAELGYPDDVANVRRRLERLNAREDAGVLVALTGGQVVAVAAYQLMELLERARPQCRITTLVVRRDQRRRGLASALLGKIESIASESGCFRLEVTTQPHRRDAADLYLTLGFRERPRRLVKPLA